MGPTPFNSKHLDGAAAFEATLCLPSVLHLSRAINKQQTNLVEQTVPSISAVPPSRQLFPSAFSEGREN
jgi:hypothetical protein